MTASDHLSGAQFSTPNREEWHPGETAHFEYHCLEDECSSDAHLWKRTHQPVKVLHQLGPEENDNGAHGSGLNFMQRGEEGIPHMYQVRFPDKHEASVWEDELMTHPKHFYRPDYSKDAPGGIQA